MYMYIIQYMQECCHVTYFIWSYHVIDHNNNIIYVNRLRSLHDLTVICCTLTFDLLGLYRAIPDNVQVPPIHDQSRAPHSVKCHLSAGTNYRPVSLRTILRKISKYAPPTSAKVAEPSGSLTIMWLDIGVWNQQPD